MAKSGYTPTQKQAIERTIVGIDELDREMFSNVLPSIPAYIAALKLGEPLLHDLLASRDPIERQMYKSRNWNIFLDLQTTSSPRLIKKTLKNYINDEWQPRFISVWALGPTGLRAAIKAVEEVAPKPGTDLVLAAVPSWMTDEDIPKRYTADELVAEQCETAKECSVQYVMTAGQHMPIISALGLRGIATGIRLPTEEKRGQERVMTPGRALKKGATLFVLGSTVTASDEPEKTFKIHIKNAAGTIARQNRLI